MEKFLAYLRKYKEDELNESHKLRIDDRIDEANLCKIRMAIADVFLGVIARFKDKEDVRNSIMNISKGWEINKVVYQDNADKEMAEIVKLETRDVLLLKMDELYE